MRASLLRLLPLLMAAGFIAGCAHYQLGTGAKLRFTTLFIAPVRSDALLPQARTLVGTQLREAFLRDGRVTLVDSPEAAEAVLEVNLAGYNRTVVVSRPEDTGRARRFDVTLTAKATLRDNRTKEAYFTDRTLTADRGVFTDDGLVSSEYQTLPLLAENLAGEAVHAVLDTW